MKAVVLYESLFGNTEAVARAIADGLAPIGQVTLVPVGEAPQGIERDADLLVLGGPTHAWGMSRPETRKSPKAHVYSTGVREWLEISRPAPGTKAAAFDTRFQKPRWLTGSAALRIARRLEQGGYKLVLPPQSFFVQHTEGPLREGEEDRARRWGDEVARRAAEDKKA
jgi:hypothetical protein